MAMHNFDDLTKFTLAVAIDYIATFVVALLLAYSTSRT
jgi:hypothetical protein